MNAASKCLHPACSCACPVGKQYCSDTCASAKAMSEITCQCRHPECQVGSSKT